MIHLGFPKMHSAPRCLFFFTGRKPQRSWRRQQKLEDGELNFESWERRTRGRRKAPDHETRDSGDRTARSHVSRQVWGKAISGHSRGGSLVCTSFIVSEERSLVRPWRQMLLEIGRYSLTGQRFQTYEASKPTSFLHTALIRRKRVLVSPQNLLSLFSLWKILNGGGEIWILLSNVESTQDVHRRDIDFYRRIKYANYTRCRVIFYPIRTIETRAFDRKMLLINI